MLVQHGLKFSGVILRVCKSEAVPAQYSTLTFTVINANKVDSIRGDSWSLICGEKLDVVLQYRDTQPTCKEVVCQESSMLYAKCIIIYAIYTLPRRYSRLQGVYNTKLVTGNRFLSFFFLLYHRRDHSACMYAFSIAYRVVVVLAREKILLAVALSVSRLCNLYSEIFVS